LFTFDVEQGLWKKFFVMEQPSPRDQHTITKMNNAYYLYGGNSSPEHKVIDDIWILNVDNVAWTSKNLDLSGINW